MSSNPLCDRNSVHWLKWKDSWGLSALGCQTNVHTYQIHRGSKPKSLKTLHIGANWVQHMIRKSSQMVMVMVPCRRNWRPSRWCWCWRRRCSVRTGRRTPGDAASRWRIPSSWPYRPRTFPHSWRSITRSTHDISALRVRKIMRV